MINKSYQKYLLTFVEDEGHYKYITDAEFAFDQALTLCLESLKEQEETGKSRLQKLFKYVIRGYLIIGKKGHFKGALQTEHVVKAHELRTYIMESFIQKLLKKMAKHMLKDLKEVSPSKKYYFITSSISSNNHLACQRQKTTWSTRPKKY